MTSDGLGDSMNNKIMVNYLDITMIKKIFTNTFHDTTASIKITARSVITQILIFGKVYWHLLKLNILISNVKKMVKHTLEILQQMLKNLYRVLDSCEHRIKMDNGLPFSFN